MDVLVCVCIVTCIIDCHKRLQRFKSANENHLSIITARIEIWGRRESVYILFYLRFLLFTIFFPSHIVTLLSSIYSSAICLEKILNQNIFISCKEKQISPSQGKETGQAQNCKFIVGILQSNFLGILVSKIEFFIKHQQPYCIHNCNCWHLAVAGINDPPNICILDSHFSTVSLVSRGSHYLLNVSIN